MPGEGSFTLQLVVDGRRSVVGSDRADTASAAAQAEAEANSNAEVAVSRENGRVSIRIGAGQGSARVMLVGFDRSLRTPIARRENNGRTVTQVNVVRALLDLGSWPGEPLTLSEPVPAGEDVAVILQQSDGRVLGPARLAPGA